MKNNIDAYANASSIHGVKYILNNKRNKSTRVFWTISILLSICGFSYYIYFAYIKFMYEIEIVIRPHDRKSHDFPAPAMTLCSGLFARDSLINISYVYNNYVRYRGRLNLTESKCEYLAANMHWCQPAFGPVVSRSICPGMNLDKIDVLKIIDESALTTEEALLFCAEGQCSQEISRVFTDFGICFTKNSLSFSLIFNNKTIHDDFKVYKRMVLKNGTIEDNSQWSPEKGFWPINNTYPHRAERDIFFGFHPILSKNEKKNLCALKNFRVFLHKPNEIVTPFHESIYVNFEEYTEFRVAVKSHRTDNSLRNFSPQKRKCFFEGEKKLKFFKSYSKALCEWECKANRTLKTCGCVKFSMPRDAKTPICNLTSLNCVEEITADNCNCLAPCDDVKYAYQLDKTHFNRDFYRSFLHDNFSLSWTQINIGSEVVDEIEHFVSYKLQNFISDFGGLLGLFMGCSLLSIVEICFFLTNAILEMIKKMRAKKSSSQVWAIKTFEVKSTIEQMSYNEILSALSILAANVKDSCIRNEKSNEEIMKSIQKLNEKYQSIETKVSVLMEKSKHRKRSETR